MSARLTLALTVACVAVAAVGGVIGVTLATRDQPPKLHAQAGKPPVPSTVPGPGGTQVRQAFLEWPHGSLALLTTLQQEYPKSPVVQFYVGLGYAWAGYVQSAVQPLEQAKKLGANTPYEVNADTLLHPSLVPGDPTFELSDHASQLLRRGAFLEQTGHRHSAEHAFAKAAHDAPNDPEALAAAAFGLFDKSDPAKAFSQLGPLAKRFPNSQSVRFNLGLLLLWIVQSKAAIVQFQKAESLGPTTTLGKQAARFLVALKKAGTTGSKK